MMSQPNPNQSSASAIVPLLCLTALAGLAAYKANPSFKSVAIAVVGGALAALVCLWLFGRVLYAFNGNVRRKYGWDCVWQAVGRSFVLLVPYTALAILADVVLGWNATLTFTSAGIMTSGAAVGAELMGLGGGRIANMVVPVVGGMGFTMVWMTVGSVLRMVAR